MDRVYWGYFLANMSNIMEKMGLLKKIEKVQTPCTDFKRLDIFLRDTYKAYSRSFLARMISQGRVSVNQQVIGKAGYLVSKEDVVVIDFPDPDACTEIPSHDIAFKILAEEEDFWVVDKPPGLIVHPPEHASQEPTLVHGLLYRFPELRACAEKKRPGIVHRLDRDTSGILIVARNDAAQAHFYNLFKERAITKVYLAVVAGHPAARGIITYPIARCLYHPKKMTHTRADGKQAETAYEVLAYYKNASLVRVVPTTGRTHQIRVHFAAIGHGIIGDGLYYKQSKHIVRHALHAHHLSFIYREKSFVYTAPEPKDFSRLLVRLQQE